MVVGIEKLSYGEIAARLADRGRPLAKKVVSVVTKPKGHPKMEIPREAYRGKGLTLEEWWGGRQVAKAVERAREARKAEELLSASKSLSRGKTIGGFDPVTGLTAHKASQAVKGLERRPFTEGATIIQKSAFDQGFFDELQKIGELWR